ncbi:MAG TPA: amidohydrolase family protein [Pyrinomonadaceae bacterium]
MKTIARLSLILFCSSLLLAQQRNGSRQILVFTHVTLIDATGAKPKPDMTVVIRDGRIAALGRPGKIRLAKRAQVVDANGKFLIPGLWDMHVHEWNKEAFFPLFIANGVTGVRDMFSPLAPIKQWRAEVAAGTTIGPQIVAAGIILDGPNPGCAPCSIAVSNAAEGRKAVLTVKEMGSDFIKVYSMLPRDAYFAIADEAKRQKMDFAGHVPEFVSAGEASDAGQKSIEHLTGILVACSAKEEELRKENEARLRADGFRSDTMTLEQSRALNSFDEKQAAALFARFKKNGTWMCPTLSVLRAQAFIGDADFRNDLRLEYIQNFIKKKFWEDAFGFSRRTAEDNEHARRVFQKQLEVVGMMKRTGVDFIAGTDTANPYVFPGFSLHDELALLVQAGFTPMEALQAATRDAARYLGRLDSVGTIENGKIADLVLLDANPLAEIGNTRKINAVVVGGTLITRPELDKMLADVALLVSKGK